MSRESFPGSFHIELDLIENYVRADVLQDDVLERYASHGINPSYAVEMTMARTGLKGFIEPLNIPDMGLTGYFVYYPERDATKRYTYLMVDHLNQRGFLGYISDTDELSARPMQPKVFSMMIDEMGSGRDWTTLETASTYEHEHWMESHVRRVGILVNSQLPH